MSSAQLKSWGHKKIKKLTWDQRAVLMAALLALIPLFFSLSRNPDGPPLPQNSESGVDTQIPRGFVLIPIEVANYEALDSVLGKFGIVDLFLPGEAQGQMQKLIAKNVRVLRAPKNPSHFAVLVPESQSSSILRFGGSFFVSVKGRDAAGTEFVKSPKNSRRKIVYEGG